MSNLHVAPTEVFRIIIFVVSALIFPSCFDGRDDSIGVSFQNIDRELIGAENVSLSQQRHALRIADPIEDARGSFKQGDSRWVGTFGFALTTPGVNVEYDYEDIKVIRWTSDALINDLHLEVNRLARIYAESYNKEMSRLRKFGKDWRH